MESLLIRNVVREGRKCDILVENGLFKVIADAGSALAAQNVIEADGLAILPAMYNTHTHAAMTLLRGYADDMELDKWLQEYIWPFEDGLKSEDIRRGSELAIKEMILTGSVFFNDMYFDIEQTIDPVDKLGIRASIGITVMDNHSLSQTEEKKRFISEFKDPTGGRIQLAMAPHSIYCVGEERFKDCVRFAREKGMKIHTHISETKKEVDDCVRQRGCSPVQYLDRIGVLGPDVIAAHCVVVSERDADILAERGVTISHCPCSNMKLASGRMPTEMLLKAGCKMTIGTDGASSNNNLDLREEMKFASLLAKVTGDPELLPAEQVFDWATKNGAEAFGIDGGVVSEGKVADCILVDLSAPKMRPCHNLISNFVYSADSSCIKATICAGRVVSEMLR